MSNIFIIADTHFGHEKILEFESAARSFTSIDEHNEAIISRWNSVVTKRDTVWHLGDVLFGENSFRLLGRLNGVKKLVLGNHDGYPTAKYLEYFNKVYGAVRLSRCILTHVPVHPSQKYRFKANIHGHMHSKKLDDPWYICVSAEHNNLTPIALEDLKKRIEA